MGFPVYGVRRASELHAQPGQTQGTPRTRRRCDSLISEKQRGPWKDRDREVDRGEERDELVDAAEVQQDAEPDGKGLRAAETDRESGCGHGRADNRVGLDARTPDADAEV